MRTITHRELRNDSSAVLRAVASGESIAITNHGVVVAHLVPPGARPELPCSRPSRTRVDFGSLVRVELEESTADVLADLRGER